ncbi:MAG TPA: SUMF1/EgtB/PvdO family nonheme iron enzyme [Pirellulales bacterium]|nr:SUMF1/EgtB/PvdO family nonheme iron enzyme [Pirellulales bacterium]
MRTAFAFVVAVLLSSTASAAGKPLPPKKSLDAAKQLVAETFAKELSEPDKTGAVKAMLEAAESTTGDDPAKAALYLSAAEVAARIGDTRLAFEAVENLTRAFDLDELATKRSILEIAADSAKSNDARLSVANRGLELAGAAVAAGNFDLADAALKTAASASAKLRDAVLRKEIVAKRRSVEKARKQAAHVESEIAAARKTLAEKPDDPAGNESLGKHLAFDRSDWVGGLKHLTKAGDAHLRTVAAFDQESPGEPERMAKAGDLWWALAEDAKDPRDQAGYKSRAVFWYTRAVDKLKGFSKTRVEKRIAEAGEEALAAAAGQNGAAGGKFVDLTLAPGVVMRLVKIPASEDGMIKEFYLGQTEVTQKQWVAVMSNNPSSLKGDSLPVDVIAWDECKAFMDRLGAVHSRMTFRFATNDEFDHACLAGQPYSYYIGAASEYIWSKENSKTAIQEVARLKPNAWGLYDMIGNVWEWSPVEGKVNGGSVWQVLPHLGVAPQHWADTMKGTAVGFRIAAEPR